MAMELFFGISFVILSATTTAVSNSIRETIITKLAPLDQNQLIALNSMNTTISLSDPCSDPSAVCDSAIPFRHLITLRLYNCPYNLTLFPTHLPSLSTLTTLELINCPINHQINPTPLSSILENMENLTTLTISYSNLEETLPKNWNSKLEHIDLSNNQLQGEISHSLKDLVCLRSFSLASNHLSGTVPSFAAGMKNLKYLNLENNDFNVTTCHNDKSWSTKAVRFMALGLSFWIFFIAFIMLLANCCP